MIRNLSVLLIFSLGALPLAAQGIITTVAGTTWTFRGAGGPAVSAPLGPPIDVAVDARGNLFIADAGNRLILKVTGGVVSVVAGNGFAGASSDGVLATAASLIFPVLRGGLTADAAGNLYLSDGQRVRKVGLDGRISTVAGAIALGFSGDGGPASTARLNLPSGLALDSSGNLYIADRGNHRVRKVSPAGIITTVAGNGTASFSGDGSTAIAATLSSPISVAVDSSGRLYIADEGNRRVRCVDGAGIITTVAGGGTLASDGIPATTFALGTVRGVTVDTSGNLYIADAGNARIFKVDPSGTIRRVAGTGFGFSGDGGPALSAGIDGPNAVAVDAAGNLFISDNGNNRIRKVDAADIITTIAGNDTFKFSGDGGPATIAHLNFPRTVVLDSAGNLYVTDVFNQRVRKISLDGTISTVAGNGSRVSAAITGPALSIAVSPSGAAFDAAGNLYLSESALIRKIVNGNISIVAGNGIASFAGDNGAATSASIRFPGGLAFDAPGNLYIADTGNQRIRKITPAGIISTVAGNGTAGFSGDGGSAISASLNQPVAVAVDSSGNLYISDSTNRRVRKVTPGGTISTFAGGGSGSGTGDGGPATNAVFVGTGGLTFDSAGNLYVADASNNRIRKVGLDGVISTVAGSGSPGFSGDGGLATAARMNFPTGVAVDSAGNIYIVDLSNDRIRKVLAGGATPTFSAAPASLTFSAASAAVDIAPQLVSISSSLAGVAWNARVSTSSGGNWLQVSPASGSAPGRLQVAVSAATLNAGTYQGTVLLEAPGANPPSVTVNVTFQVAGAGTARLSLQPASLSFEGLSGSGNPSPQSLQIANAGSGSLAWTSQAQTSRGGNWLGVSPASGSATAAVPATAQVSVNLSGLAAGVYSGSVRIASSTTGETQTVEVTLVVSQAQSILLSQSGLAFTAVSGGAGAPSQEFAVVNAGAGVMTWTAEGSTLSGGGWLSVSPTRGSSNAASTGIPFIEVRVNSVSLAAGNYTGLVKVTATGASNSPQVVTVKLSVLPAGSIPAAQVRPAGLVFAAQAGGSTPGSQTVRVATGKTGTVEFLTGVLASGGDWLEAQPRNALLSASEPKTISLQPSAGTLVPGVYRGVLTLLFLDGSPSQVVEVLFVVASSSGSAAEFSDGPQPPPGCTPSRLVTTTRTLSGGFSSPVGFPTPIELQVSDDCGDLVTNATAIVTFSNGDPPLALANLKNGTYSGTWRPVNPASSQVTVNALVTAPGLTSAQSQLLGQVGGTLNTATLFAGGVVSAASFAKGAPHAPGAIVSVFGKNLAAGTNFASSSPLERRLGGASVNIGGVDAPMYFSNDGQINAQIPFELTVNSRPQVYIRTAAGGTEAVTVPESITVAESQPAIFTINQQGTGQAAILDGNGRLVDSSNAASSGQVVAVFCTGLGATNPRVDSGLGAPGVEPLARVVAPVTATIGGQSAAVSFAGLAPGFVGLYQVNVQVPVGTAPGGNVTLLLTQNGVASNSVTLAVR